MSSALYYAEKRGCDNNMYKTIQNNMFNDAT